ncbi:hypothetical protein [Dysgonomonas sp.]
MCDFFSTHCADIWIAFIGAFFGFGLALAIEFFIRWLSGKDEKKRIKQEKADKVAYYRLLLEEIVKKIKKQSEKVEEYIEEQSKALLDPKPLPHIPTNSFNRIKTVDNRGIFEALSDRFVGDSNWLKNYSNLNSYIDYLDEVISVEYIRINDTTLDKGFEDLKEIKKLIESIPDILSKEAMVKKEQFGEKRKADAEYQFLDKFILKFRELSQETPTNWDKFNKDFLEPILKEIEPFQTKDYALSVIFACKQARVKMNDVKEDLKYTLSQYKQINETLSEPISELEKMISKLKS